MCLISWPFVQRANCTFAHNDTRRVSPQKVLAVRICASFGAPVPGRVLPVLVEITIVERC